MLVPFPSSHVFDMKACLHGICVPNDHRCVFSTCCSASCLDSGSFFSSSLLLIPMKQIDITQWSSFRFVSFRFECSTCCDPMTMRSNVVQYEWSLSTNCSTIDLIAPVTACLCCRDRGERESEREFFLRNRRMRKRMAVHHRTREKANCVIEESNDERLP